MTFVTHIALVVHPNVEKVFAFSLALLEQSKIGFL